MTCLDPEFRTRSRAAFLTERGLTLAALRSRIAAGEANPTTRRDLLSALHRVERMFGVSLEEIPATPRALRGLFATRPSALEVSAKTLANIRANVNRALRAYGEPVPQLTRRIPPNESWQALLGKVAIDPWRQGLYRLACFCSVMGVEPAAVDATTLAGLHEALEAEEVVKSPKTILKTTINSWNRCRRTIADWPNIALASPFKPQPWTLPLEAFPETFRADIARWVGSVTEIDPLALDGPARPLRPVTVEHRIREFRMMASALVNRNILPTDRITGIDVLVEPANFKEAMRFFLDRQGGKTTARLHNLANAMRLVARHHVKADEAMLTELAAICRKLNPGDRNRMTEKNRQRLRPFEDDDVIVRFLRLPETLACQARSLLASRPLKAAQLMERAVLFAIQTHYALRPRTVRGLHLERNFLWDGPRRCFLVLHPEDLKTGNRQEFELSNQLATLLDEHLNVYRPHLPGSGSPWLFPGTDGRPRSKNALYDAIRSTAGKHAGLVINPHLFRHALAKIVVEQAPELEGSVRQTLGHTTLATTYAHYLGTETRSAGRHLDRVLERISCGKETDE